LRAHESAVVGRIFLQQKISAGQFGTFATISATSGSEQSQQTAQLFNHFVDGSEQFVRHSEAKYRGKRRRWTAWRVARCAIWTSRLTKKGPPLMNRASGRSLARAAKAVWILAMELA
jgi:hypothetical protein